MVSPIPSCSTHRERRRAGHNALAAHPGFGEPQVQRVIAHRRQRAVDVDQILHPAHLGAENDLVVAQAVPFRRLRRLHRARHHGVQRHIARILRLGQGGVFVHHARQQGRIQRAPVHPDAHRFIVLRGHLDHGLEVVVVLAADIRIAGIDPVLGQRAGAFGILLQQNMAVVMEIADDRHAHAELLASVHDLRNRRRRLLGIHRHPHQLRTGSRQRHHLVDCRRHIRRVGIGHRLHHDRMRSPYLHTSHVNHYRLAARFYTHASPFG